MVQRLTYRRRCSYNTPSNKVKIVRLPGRRNAYHHIDKSTSRPKCGDCKMPLQGIPAIRPHKMKLLKKRERHVSRAYGGSRCHSCVRNRILRAFLVEEQRCVKVVFMEKEKQKSDAAKKTITKTKKGSKKSGN